MVELQQQHRSGGTDASRREARLVRSNSLPAEPARSLPNPDRAVMDAASANSKQLESLQREINTVVQQQEEVVAMLKRRGGLFRGLSNRLKSAIRGGEHEVVRERERGRERERKHLTRSVHKWRSHAWVACSVDLPLFLFGFSGDLGFIAGGCTIPESPEEGYNAAPSVQTAGITFWVPST